MGELHDVAIAALARVRDRLEIGPPDAELLPVPAALREVVPALRRGQVMQVEAGALAMALIAEASAQGSWSAVVGMPDFGMLAASAMGCDVERLLLVDEPGEHWVEVVAALVAAVDVVLVRPPSRPPLAASPPPRVVRRLSALVRKCGSCLLVDGPWDGAMLRVGISSSVWTGVGQGDGHLRGRRVKVVADGRGAGGRTRSAWLWLPGPDGSVSRADLVQVGGHGDDVAPPSSKALMKALATETVEVA